MVAKKVHFVSESLPISPVNYRMAQDFFYAGHHPINPVIQHNGLIAYERGAAAIGATPHGELILMSTTDIDDLRLEHRFAKDGITVSKGENDVSSIPEKQRVVGQDILGDSSVYLGQFIGEQRLNRSDTNYDHILGVAAWKPTPKHLIHSLLQQFSAYHRQDLLDSGILMHHSDLTWTSREMVFAAKPSLKRKWPLGKGDPVQNTQGEPLYTLKTLIAPSKGFDSAQLYHRHFSVLEKSTWRKMVQALMCSAVGRICQTEKDLTLEEIKEKIAMRFSPAAKLLRQGKSTYTHDLINGEYEPRKGLEKLKGRLKRAFTASVYGLGSIRKIDVMTGVALPAALGLAGHLTENPELSLAVMTIPVVVMTSRFGFLWMSRSRHSFVSGFFNDVVSNFWPKDVRKKNIPDQFEMINPDVIKYLRILPRRELDSLTQLPINHAEQAPLWDMLYILGMQNGPYGSHASFHKSGKQQIVRVKENTSTSGMTIEYWPLLRTAFARDAVSETLPQTLLDEFRHGGAPIRMVRALRDDDSGMFRYESRFITQEEYDSTIEQMGKAHGRDIYRHEETTAKYLGGYPLQEIEEKDHGKERWASDEKAATLAELVEISVEAAKNFIRAPHI